MNGGAGQSAGRSLDGQLILWPSEKLRPEDGRLQGEPMSGVDRVVAGQGPDPIQSVGDRPHGQMQPNRRRSGDTPAVEVRLQGIEKWSGTAARLMERFECRMDQVDHGGLITEKDPMWPCPSLVLRAPE